MSNEIINKLKNKHELFDYEREDVSEIPFEFKPSNKKANKKSNSLSKKIPLSKPYAKPEQAQLMSIAILPIAPISLCTIQAQDGV